MHWLLLLRIELLWYILPRILLNLELKGTLEKYGDIFILQALVGILCYIKMELTENDTFNLDLLSPYIFIAVKKTRSHFSQPALTSSSFCLCIPSPSLADAFSPI